MLKRAGDVANFIQQAKDIHIVTHIDADGIAAGAIAAKTLQRLRKSYTIECVKQLDELVMKRILDDNHELVWFTDLGSSISTTYKELSMIITDHHTCPPDANLNFHLNPHLFGLDGASDISGAGTTYLVSKALDKKNSDLASLAIIGACGDLQDRTHGMLQGMNREIIQDGTSSKVLKAIKDIRFFGRETKSLSKLLSYANDPFLPGLSRREEACLTFLHELGIHVKHGDTERKWVDLSKDERQLILSALAQLLLSKGFGHTLTWRLIGEIYVLPKEEEGTELHEAKEFATLLNSTARYGQHEVGLEVCLGDRNNALKAARNLLLGHRQNIMEGLQFARDEHLEKREFVQYYHAGEGIRDTIIGIVTNMLLQSDDVEQSMPLFGFADTENGCVKVSARAPQGLVNRGLNLSLVMKTAAKKVEGVGGGHNIAAGATIPKGKEEEFLAYAEQVIKTQLS